MQSSRFNALRLPSASVECLYRGTQWSEGPVWFDDGNCLLWSDIPNNRILRWDGATGAVTTFRQPSNHANGNTRDHEGRLVTCEHQACRVTRTGHNGTITVLADSYQGRRLNSPNDVVVKADGSIWFTDPSFAINSFNQGAPRDPELRPGVYRIDGQSGEVSLVSDEIHGPNGLAFSPDEARLYVVDSRDEPRKIRVFDVVRNGRALAGNRVLIDAGEGRPDGLRVDIHGNLWCAWGMGAGLDGVRVFSPDGELLGHIELPERCMNVCFGGEHRNRLFMATVNGLYALYANTRGVI
ncbi:SMP-30/gluconolactonase/LRE family protein [Paraburkholderia edwinii]|uniref:SMP-30/gluconolactonase/LRE family protein n=1 Tax=Paraburkholderia edwinii TaxID=2861782 RepID=A0ABX8UWP1_9BURK|nr:SMP-30/gluconolactonase/LRE family protein [Paraburkholderia edwinii]QYD73301.1 SMP-30/gluconolactonase/LRE family protein [Paraburkholderia edwinii]